MTNMELAVRKCLSVHLWNDLSKKVVKEHTFSYWTLRIVYIVNIFTCCMANTRNFSGTSKLITKNRFWDCT